MRFNEHKFDVFSAPAPVAESERGELQDGTAASLPSQFVFARVGRQVAEIRVFLIRLDAKVTSIGTSLTRGCDNAQWPRLGRAHIRARVRHALPWRGPIQSFRRGREAGGPDGATPRPASTDR